MQNKECGRYRPTYFCMKDNRTSLLWVVPMSKQVEKYKKIYDKQVEKYGECLTIVFGKFDNQMNVFLLQNIPITEYYIDHIHTRNGIPVPIRYSLQKKIRSNMKRIFQILSKGKHIVFTDVSRLEKIMLAELNKSNTIFDVDNINDDEISNNLSL